MPSHPKRNRNRQSGRVTLWTLAARVKAVEQRVAQMDSLINRHTDVYQGTTILRGWSAIGQFLGISSSSARRWGKKMALPAARIGRHVLSDKEWIRRWLLIVGEEKRRLRENR